MEYLSNQANPFESKSMSLHKFTPTESVVNEKR